MAVLLSDVGDPYAPVDSEPWCVAQKAMACTLIRRKDVTVRTLKSVLQSLSSRDNYAKIKNEKGVSFKTWKGFVEYRTPFGLGLPVEMADAVLHERDETRLLRDTLAQHGGARCRKQGSDPTLNIKTIGRGKDYQIARLERDAPEIAAKLDEYPSVHAAAKAAGIIKSKTALDSLRAAWRKATPEHRQAFLDEIRDDWPS